MSWPPIKHPSMHFGNAKSQVVLVTLWTPAEQVLQTVDVERFALVAPMYSRRRGIGPLLRSLLANKNIRYVFVTGADLDEGGKALVSFFEHGVVDGVIADTDVEVDLPKRCVADIREHVQIVDCRNLQGKKQWSKINTLIDEKQRLPRYGKDEVLAEPEPETPLVWPSTQGGFCVHGRTLVEAHCKLLRDVVRFGEIKRHVSDEPTKDLSCVRVSVDAIGFHRALPFLKKDGEYYKKQIQHNVAKGVPYSYGRRIRSRFGFDQLHHVVDLLKNNAYSRKGVFLLWEPKDLLAKSAPGVVYVHVAIVQHAVVLTVHVRCMDVCGVAETIYGFSGLQAYIAEATGFDMGAVHAVLDMVYLPMSQLSHTKKYLDKHKDLYAFTAHDDPRGNIVVSLRDGKLLVTHVSQNDEVLGEWSAKTAKEIYRVLAHENVLFDDYHKFDIGAELQKAESCLQRGVPYHQDRRNIDK